MHIIGMCVIHICDVCTLYDVCQTHIHVTFPTWLKKKNLKQLFSD